jgi:hypothetical protein
MLNDYDLKFLNYRGFVHWKEPHFGDERAQGDFDLFHGKFDPDAIAWAQSERQEGVRVEFVFVFRCPPVQVNNYIQPNE